MTAIEQARVAEVTRLHLEVDDHLRNGLSKALRIGELLADQRGSLKHGDWLRWVRDNLPFTGRTARRYLQLHANRERLKLDTVSDLNSAYRLLSPRKGDPELDPDLRASCPRFATAWDTFMIWHRRAQESQL